MTVVRHVSFLGLVQGVGFRAFVEYEATRRGLQGWVRNRRSGEVEAVFAGDPRDLDAVIGACREGPAMARVDAVDQRDATAEELALRGREAFAVLQTV